MIRDHYERRLLLLDSDYEATKRRLAGRVRAPHAEGREGGRHSSHSSALGTDSLDRSTDGLTVRLAKKAYRWYFGKFPRVTHRNPQWAPLRHSFASSMR